MLLTKEIEIRIAGNVGQYYKKNNIDVKFNQINKLPIQVINPESHLIIDAKCDVCGKEVKVQYRRYNQSISRGGYYTCSSKCGSQKRKDTCIEKYGCENFVKTDDFKEKSQQTNLKKWGEKHFRQSEKWKINNGKNETCKRKNTQFKKFLLDNPNVVGQTDENFIVNCQLHGEVEIPKGIFSNRKIYRTELCAKCNPINPNVSGKEILLKKMIGELYEGDIVTSYKVNRKEIDIFIPELKIGFEFNGLRWHSEKFINKNYHIDKTKLCESNGIRLIHIFEDDFDYKTEIVRSMVKNLLGKSTKIYGRKTEIKKITDKNIVKKFLTENHLQGFVNSNYNYGLYYGGELISMMTFMKVRKILNNKSEEGSYELIRFCNKLNYSVVGGASKLFSGFINEISPKNIISYCDISWASGNLYYNLGMEYIGLTKPNYHYVVNDRRESRIKYQKHKLVKDGYDEKLTERQIMIGREIYRIYNCGNKVFKLNLK